MSQISGQTREGTDSIPKRHGRSRRGVHHAVFPIPQAQPVGGAFGQANLGEKTGTDMPRYFIWVPVEAEAPRSVTLSPDRAGHFDRSGDFSGDA